MTEAPFPLRMLTLSTKAGLDGPLINAYTRFTGRMDYLDGVDSQIREYQYPGEFKGDVLIPILHAQGGTDYIYCIIAHILQTRGYRPVFPICHDDMSLCFRKRTKPDDVGTCALCHDHSLRVFEAFGLEDFVDENCFDGRDESHELIGDHRGKFTHEGVDVGTYARSSARKFLGRYRLVDDSARDRDVYRRFTGTGVQLVDMTIEQIERRDLVACTAHHPGYVYGGVVLETAAEHGIHSTGFGVGFRDDTILIGNQRNRLSYPEFADGERVETAMGRELTEREQRRVKSLLDRNEAGKSVTRRDYFGDFAGDVSFPEGKKLIALYPNLLWDAQIDDINVLFSSIPSWLTTTIDYLRNRSEYHLVIKPHPAEETASDRTKETTHGYIGSIVDPLPKNVTIIESGTDIDPYVLAMSADLAVVYTSTVGLELACHGVPVLTAGDTHYRDLDFTFDPSSIDEYFDYLDTAGSLEMTDEMQTRAIRYLNFLLYEHSIEWPYPEFGTQQHIAELTHEELLPGNEPADTIASRILGKPVEDI